MLSAKRYICPENHMNREESEEKRGRMSLSQEESGTDAGMQIFVRAPPLALCPLSPEEKACFDGLCLWEHLGATGHWVPMLLVRDFLKSMNGFEGARAIFIATKSHLTLPLRFLRCIGASLEKRNGRGNTLLHEAVYKFRLDRISLLSKKQLIFAANKEGMTPLHIAAERGNLPCLSLLLKAGADIDARIFPYGRNFVSTGNMSWESFGRRQPDSYIGGRPIFTGSTALFIALRRLHDNCIKFLIEEGANVDVWDSSGESLLHWSVKHGRVEYTEQLIKAGAVLDRKNFWGQRPLHVACDAVFIAPSCNSQDLTKRKLKILKLLIDSGASLELHNRQGMTPLHLAVVMGFTHAVKILVEAGADVVAPSTSGRTAPQAAQERHYDECLQILQSAAQKQCQAPCPSLQKQNTFCNELLMVGCGPVLEL